MSTIYANFLLPEDIFGLPFLKDGEEARQPPEWAVALTDGGSEREMTFANMSKAPPKTQEVIRKLAAGEEVRGLRFSPDTIITLKENE